MPVPGFFLVRRPRRDLVHQTKCLTVVERFRRKDTSPAYPISTSLYTTFLVKTFSESFTSFPWPSLSSTETRIPSREVAREKAT